ncbi:hypothetical protein O6H91_18G047600 [Diphasiastrum complanatum]|nr:hypothetical protein O6H91_18G047600 [Diphasiastrum complanatum]
MKTISIGNPTFPKDVKIEDAGTGGDAESAACLTESDRQQALLRHCCFYCKKLRKRNFDREPSLERTFSKVSVESLEDQSSDSFDFVSTESENSLANTQEQKRVEFSTLYGDELYKKGEARSRDFHADSFKPSKNINTAVKYDATLEVNNILNKDQENATAIPHADAKKEGLKKAREPENREQDLREAIQLQREAHSALSKELEEERNASAIAASETLAMIARLQEENAAMQRETGHFKRIAEDRAVFDQQAVALLQEILFKREEENFALERDVKLCRRRLLDDSLRQWRRQSLKREDFELENQYEAGRMSMAKRREKSALLLETRNQNPSMDPGQIRQGLQDHGEHATVMGTVDTTSDGLTEIASKLNSVNEIDVAKTENTMKVHIFGRQMNSFPQSRRKNSRLALNSVQSEPDQEELQDQKEKVLQESAQRASSKVRGRKRLIKPEMCENEALNCRMAKREEKRSRERKDMADGRSYKSLSSIYPIKRQHKGEKFLRPFLDPPEISKWGSNTRNKEILCSEGAYSENDDTVLGFYFETESEECWRKCEDLLKVKTDVSMDPNDNVMEDMEDCITIEMNSAVKILQEHDEKIKEVVGVEVTSHVNPYQASNHDQAVCYDSIFLSDKHQADLRFASGDNPDVTECSTASQSSTSICSRLSSPQVDRKPRKDDNIHVVPWRKAQSVPPFTSSDSSPQDTNDILTHAELLSSLKSPETGRFNRTTKQRGDTKHFFDQKEKLVRCNKMTISDGLQYKFNSSADNFFPGASECDLKIPSAMNGSYSRTAIEKQVKQLAIRLQMLEDDRQL